MKLLKKILDIAIPRFLYEDVALVEINGNYEIVFADSDADLMIYEYKNGEFTFEFSI